MKNKLKTISIAQVMTGSAMWQPEMIIRVRCRHCGTVAAIELGVVVVGAMHRCNCCGAMFGRVPRELQVWARALLVTHGADPSAN